MKIKKMKLNDEHKPKRQEEKNKKREERKLHKYQFKLTHLKMRQIKLAFSFLSLILTKYGREVASKVVDKDIQSRLVELYAYLSGSEMSTFRLRCLSCLNKTLLFKCGIDKFIESKVYSKIVSSFVETRNDSSSKQKVTTRVGILMTSILSKVSF